MALLFLCLLHSYPTEAQVFEPDLKKIITTASHSPSVSNPVSGKLHIVAVMTEFEEDDNRLTTGTGLFSDSGMPFLNNSSIRIDPLPHNRNYFEAHLTFAKNYFETVSNGKLEIEFTVLPEIVKLSDKMERYSPTGRELNFLPVAEMAAETWKQVNEKNLVKSLQNSNVETAFVIFHAGVGRDIELVGTTLNKTPQDIPSVYLSKTAFRDLFDDPSFEGFPLDEADAMISNTLILPRTLSRPGEDVSGNSFVLQLSINGLVTAQIGSHIGLPDLFDTENGESGIGRFGLMDGAGIFSYNGLFPPEMSAWEKSFLGWVEPELLSTRSELTAELPAASLRQENSVFKVELSKSEYFLIENRHRDPENDGVTIEIQKPDGSLVTQTVSNKDRDFTFQQQGYEQMLESGVIVSVSNYDFSLPGGLFEENETSDSFRELNGGILIWHIDENIIAKNISLNSINAGLGPNGVSLVEADGAQDIGNPISNGLFSNESNGWAFDFWWNGNNASVITQTNTIQFYSNRFGPDTTPNNNSHSGASAGFELFDFSDNLPISTFKLRSVNPYSSLYREADMSGVRDLSVSTLTADSHYWKAYPLSVQPVILHDKPYLILPGSDGIEMLNPENRSLLQTSVNSEEDLQQPHWNNEFQQLTTASSPEGQDPITLRSFKVNDQVFEQIWSSEAMANEGFISQSVPDLLDLDHTNQQIDLGDGAVIQNQNAVQKSEQISGVSARIFKNQLAIQFSEGEKFHTIPEISGSIRKHTGIIQQSNGEIFVYLLLDNKLLLFKESESFDTTHVINEDAEIEWPAFGDINNDGFTDILYVNLTLNTLEAKTITGAVLPYFPISAGNRSIYIGTPLLSDIDGDGNQDILVQTVTNASVSLVAFDPQTNPVEGFPLLIGGGASEGIGTIHPAFSGKHLLAVSPEGDLKLWNFQNSGGSSWPAKYGAGVNNKVSANVDVEPTFFMDGLIVTEETYNWPNPAKNFTTIRFLTSQAANVDIDVISASGKKVFSKSTETSGTVVEEIRLDTTHWASGAYFARVKAKSAHTTDQTIIKIAIAK